MDTVGSVVGGATTLLNLVEQPELILQAQQDADDKEGIGAGCKQELKQLFDLAKKLEPKTFSPLPELLVDGFTLEQIWEEIEMYNVPSYSYLQKQVDKHSAALATIELEGPPGFDDEDGSDKASGTDDDGEDGDDPYAKFRDGTEESEQDGSDDDSDPEIAAENMRRGRKRPRVGGAEGEGSADGMKQQARVRKRRHAMENSFFSLDAMEAFMDEAQEEYMAEYDEQEDEKKKKVGWSYEEGDADDSHPYSDDEEDLLSTNATQPDGDTEEMQYKDFFDPPDKVTDGEAQN
jgi:U3 small nucleolar RNA-associated protein MPP10